MEFSFQPTRRWQQFFIKIKKPHLCFHCLRVTYERTAGAPTARRFDEDNRADFISRF